MLDYELTAAWVPDLAHEALRDLVRAPEAAGYDLRRARHRLQKLVLRLGRRAPQGTRAWSAAYWRWVRGLTLPHPAQEAVRVDYLSEVERLAARVRRLDGELAAVVGQVPPAVRAVIEARQALRGVALLTAVTAAAEIGAFSRFARPRPLMAYSGLVPREHSSGGSVWWGGITKTGNTHLRRVVIEAAWHYRHGPALSASLRRRQAGQPPAVCAIAAQAQHRLHARYRRLLGRGTTKQQTIVALGRIARAVEGVPVAPAHSRAATRTTAASGMNVPASRAAVSKTPTLLDPNAAR